MNTPSENFSKGLFRVDIPELGEPIRGKVRDSWVINKNGSKFRLMITTDRQWAYLKPVCTIPGKGQISNLISAYWFELTRDIVPNHMIAIPHPNVLIAREAKHVIPIEVVLRRYMAKSGTPTSIYYNYMDIGRREIYGIKLPEGLKANEELPMGTILTPTTKAPDGHDKELTDAETRKIVDDKLGNGTWDKVKIFAYAVFERARTHSLEKGLILADTKFEFGVDTNGNLMLIDELLTPECSRFWLLETHEKRFMENKGPEPDKDVLVRWLAENGFTGKGLVPKIDDAIISKQFEAYAIPYKMITGNDLAKPANYLSGFNPKDLSIWLTK